MKWRGLTTFGKGLLLALCAAFIRAFSSIAASERTALLIMPFATVIFYLGLFIALFGMFSHFKEFEKIQMNHDDKE